MIAFAMLALSALAPTPWHHPLSLGNGGLWRQRVAVTVENTAAQPMAASPVPVRIGPAPDGLPIVSAEVKSLRVCNDRGEELLFDVSDANGKPVRSGRAATGGTLTIPVDCEAGQTMTCFVYFDNPLAWMPPDWLEAASELRNGSVEDGNGDAPTGWVHDPADPSHIASWTDEASRTGSRSLKLWVREGAEPSWISTRQTGIRLSPGGRYRVTAWVKAEGVVGYAGWYLHIGNAANTMMQAPMLGAGDGTYDWKQVALEFTAPAGADRVSLGTVLRGTGVAWFDDVALERLDEGEAYAVRIGPPERLRLTESGSKDPWPAASRGSGAAVYRTPIRIVNFGDRPASGFVSMEVSAVLRRLQARMRDPRIVVRSGGKELRSYRLGSNLLFEAQVAPRSVTTLYAYPQERGAAASASAATVKAPVQYAPNPAVPGGMNKSAVTVSLADYAALAASPRNLARNPGFEMGEAMPDAWVGGTEGERPAGTVMGLADEGLFGRRCARMNVPATSKPAWTGWRQDVRVEPGRTYLFAAWLRCRDIEGGVQLHAHLRTERGDLVRQGGMVGAGPAISGTTGWTLLAGAFRTPEDCRIFQMHLTMLATGSVWHDGVLLIEVSSAEALALQSRSPSGGPSVRVWAVNPIVKVFREDLPASAGASSAALVCAGNEYEPLQIAVRSGRDIRNVRVIVDRPRSAAGKSLTDVEVGLVGYVPVDAPTNYYSDTTPSHRRKQPNGAAGSDGWAGWWPDPILPHAEFDLKAGVTQPVWVTVHVPKGSQAGTYRGAVRLVASDRSARTQTIASLPFSVRVLGFDLPDATRFRAIYDCRQSGAVWRLPGKSESESREEFWRFMARRRVCPDTIKPEPSFTYSDGVARADFTEFDRAAAIYFGEMKFPHAYTPWHFYVFGWGHLPGDKFGQKPYEGEYPYEGVDRSKLRPEFKRAYQACLKLYWDHMKAKGWADRVVLYISDEPHDHMPGITAQMKALCDMIHEVDPAIPIYSSTWHHQPEWDGKLDVWGIGHYGIVSVDRMRAIREGGARIWWTTDGQMCTDTPYAAIERLLPHYAFKYGAEAYEFWGIDWLTYDPHRYGWHGFLPHDFGPGQDKVFVRYPNGDGFLAYPPIPSRPDRFVTSVRLEQAREGVEDWEYLNLLRRLVDDGKRAGKDTSAGERALRSAESLVTSPCEIGRYSTRILPDPDRVLSAKLAVGQVIEAMQRSAR